MPEKNRTTSDSLAATLTALVSARFDDVFLIDPAASKRYTYGEFFSFALNGADALRKSGISRGDTVSMVLRNRAETLIIYMAALLAGARIALIDPEKGVEDMKAVYEQIDAKTTVADTLSTAFGRNSIPAEYLVQSLKTRLRPAEDIVEAFADIREDEVFLITFTSGSTGVPKGVEHSARNLFLSSRAFGERFGFDERHIFYHHLPMTYVAGVLNSFILPLVRGSKLVVGERFSVGVVSRFWDVPAQYGVNVFWFVPTMLSLLMKLDRSDAGKKYAQKGLIGCVGTAPLSPVLHREFEGRYDIPLFESYGLSETLFVSTQSPGNDKPMGSVGLLLSGARVESGADGELSIQVPWMYKGYVREKREELFEDSAFVSGDLGAISEDGLRITGRKKDIIIRGGVNVSPRHIEEYLAQRMVFEEAVVMGFPDDIMGERIVCFFVPQKAGFSDDIRSSLLSDMRTKLGKESVIDEFVQLSEIPKNTNGKVDVPKIRARYNGS